MTISLIQAHELDASLINRWRSIQASNPNLRSPYYTPDYAMAVHDSLRHIASTTGGADSGVEIAIIESPSTHQVVGFFPFQRGPWGQVYPAGRYLTDYQGLVCADGFSEFNASQLLSGMKARYFAFNHLPLTAAVFAPDVRIHHLSPVLNTEGGYEAYANRLREVQGTPHPGVFAEVRKRTNRIVRELGPLRFEMHEPDGIALEKLITQKTAQWKIGNPDGITAFEMPWINHLIHALYERSNAHLREQGDPAAFRLVLSALYAGDTLMATQLSLRHAQTLHCWFPAYDPALSTYSAGTVLMKPLTEVFAGDGISLIDLGRGAATYKMRVCTGTVPLGEGASSSPALLARAYMGSKLAWRAGKERLARWKSPAAAPSNADAV